MGCQIHLNLSPIRLSYHSDSNTHVNTVVICTPISFFQVLVSQKRKVSCPVLSHGTCKSIIFKKHSTLYSQLLGAELMYSIPNWRVGVWFPVSHQFILPRVGIKWALVLYSCSLISSEYFISEYRRIMIRYVKCIEWTLWPGYCIMQAQSLLLLQFLSCFVLPNTKITLTYHSFCQMITYRYPKLN